MRKLLLALLGCLLLSLAWAQAARPKPSSGTGFRTSPPSRPALPDTPVPRFEDAGVQAGLTVSHISTPDKKYIVESMSGGAGLIDCDNDGKLDILTVNGSTIERYRSGGDPMVTLYHQDAGLK